MNLRELLRRLSAYRLANSCHQLRDQAKTVDQVIASVPVRAFSQANKAQFYVSMSRARYAMHLLTDSKEEGSAAGCRH